MKAIDNGCFYSVKVSAREVENFKDSWPCSALPSCAFWFQFDRRNGDLVDMRPNEYDGEDLLALSQDAQEFGKKSLSIQ